MLYELQDSVEAAGRRFAILYVPVHAQLKGTLNEAQTWKPSLLRYAEERGVQLLDPTAAFLEKIAGDIAMYDDHWTPAGHEVVADLLAKWLAENP